MRKKQFGLASIQLIILLVVLAVVVLAGWRVSINQNGQNSANDCVDSVSLPSQSVQSSNLCAAPVNSYADCVKAGYPVQESYPTVCNANGKSFTNPDQSASGVCVIGAGGPCNRSETPVQPY